MKRPMKRLCALMTAALTVLVLCAGVFALPAAAASEAKIEFMYDKDTTFYICDKDADGNTLDSSKDLNITDLQIKSPERTGYTFLGWFKEYEATTPIWSISKEKDALNSWGKLEKKEDANTYRLYAGWAAVPITPTPTPAPVPTPDPYSGEGAAIVAATATDAGGGEMPLIKKDDRFTLVLKVVDHSAARFSVPANDIAARLNSAAFTYTGTAEVGQLYEETDPVTGTRYYSYVLIFRDIIYNGGGNEVAVDISYLNSTLAMQQLSVTLAQCAGADASPAPDRTPNLVVRESSYGSNAITAGTPFTLNVTVFATAGDESLADVIASVTLPKGITLTGGSLSQYVGTMTAGSAVNVQFQVLPSAAFTDGVADLTVNLTGTGLTTGSAVTSDTKISVPILQPDRFEISNIDCSDTVYIGQGGSITVNFVNKGRNVVANLEAEITGNNLGVDIPRVYVGNVNAGTENSVDFSLYPEMPGPMDGTITLTYESEDGTVKTLTETFSATAMEMDNYYDPGMFEDPGMMDEPAQAGLPVWGWVLIALAVIAAIVAAVVLVRRRKKAKALAALGEADDEDF